MSDGKRITKKVVRKLEGFTKGILSTIYFTSTSTVIAFVYIYIFNLKDNFLYAIAVSGISFVAMDIICSIAEDIASAIYKLIIKMQKKKRRKRQQIESKAQSEIDKLEELIKERTDLSSQIETIFENCVSFKDDIQSCKELPSNLKKQLINLCERMEKILQILEQDIKEYYPIRHTFRVIFPKIQKSTYTFMNLAKADNLDEDTKREFGKLITEFNNQLDYVKSSISSTDKLSLNVEIETLIRTMQTERKNGDINA